MSSEKTEQPTPKRLRESREKGQVAKSQDVPSALTVMAVAVYLLAMSSDMLNTLLAMGEAPMLLMDRPFEEALPLAVTSTLLCALRVALPLIGMVMVVALCANMMQVGVLFSVQAAMPKLENLSMNKWFKQVFSLKNLVEFLKNIIKVLILGISATIHPLTMGGITLTDILVVVLSSLLLFMAAFTFRSKKLDRWEGAIFLAIYIAYIWYLVR